MHMAIAPNVEASGILLTLCQPHVPLDCSKSQFLNCNFSQMNSLIQSVATALRVAILLKNSGLAKPCGALSDQTVLLLHHSLKTWLDGETAEMQP